MTAENHSTPTARIPPQYFAILATIPAAAYISDNKGLCLDCTAEFAVLVGRPKAAVVGQLLPAADPPDAGERQADGLLKPEGNLYGHFGRTPILDGAGEVVGVFGVRQTAAGQQANAAIRLRSELYQKYSRDYIFLINPGNARILEANPAACKAYGYSATEFGALTVYDLRVKESRAAIDAQLTEACTEGILFETLHRRKDGTIFPVEVNSAGSRVEEQDVVVSIARDVSEWVNAAAALRLHNEYLAMLHETALSLINHLDVDALLGQIITRAGQLASSKNAFILIRDPQTGLLTMQAGVGLCAEHVGAHFPAGQGLIAEVIATGGPVVINDCQQWPRRANPPGLEGITAMLGAPLRAHGQMTGIIGFIGLEPSARFDEKDVQMVEEFANLASLALSNASLYGRLQQELASRIKAEEELRKANAALQASEQRNRVLLEAIPDALFVVSPKLTVLDIKPPKNFTYYQAEAGSKDIAALVPPELRALYGEKIAEAFNTGQEVWFQYPITLDKVTRYRDARILLLSPAEALIIVRDITAVRQAQEQIHKLSFAVEQSPGAMIITDVDGNITYVNGKFCELTGYQPEEVIGRNPRLLQSGHNAEDFYHGLWRTLAAGEEWRGEFCNRKKDGGAYWALTSISPVRSLDGVVAYYLAVQQDITEQKALEKTLQAQNVEIQEALAQLQRTQTQLLQQEKFAGIGQLAAGVAHEINNPLGFVTSNFATMKKYVTRLTDLVKAYQVLHKEVLAHQTPELMDCAGAVSRLAQEKKLEYILGDLEALFQETNEGLDRVGNVVQALRLFSRVDQQSSFEDYDLNEGIRISLILARNEIKYVAGVEEELADLPPVQAIGAKINQVILNLLVNAAHAIKAKASNLLGRIKVSTYADAQFVYCSVADSGVGIAENIRPDVFNPFFTTKPVGQGTGLGLSISYDIIVNKHGGEISFASEVGQGTIFTFKLPRDRSTVPETAVGPEQQGG